MALVNFGAQFVRKFITLEWPKERRSQTRWCVMPRESDLNSMLFLFNFTEGGPFVGLQLIFEVILHEEHPMKPPSLKTWTPNGRTIPRERLCINGLTAYHPESWSPITTVNSIVERFIAAFSDLDNVDEGVGFCKGADTAEYTMFASLSAEWNKENFPELVELWKEQCAARQQEGTGGASASEATDDAGEVEYIYSDDEGAEEEE